MTQQNNTPENDSTDVEDCSEQIGSRRRFLQKSAGTAALGAVSVSFLSVLFDDKAGATPQGENAAPKSEKETVEYGFLVDPQKCIGCGKCMLACHVENKVPEENHRTWVERYVYLKDGTIQVDISPEAPFAFSDLPIVDSEGVEKAFFVPKLCNHCDDAPCCQVCPVHAAFTSPEGFVLIDSKRCIGCSYCVQACPYGVRFINHTTGTADKCTWCYHRIKKGEQPACVEVCPTEARLFGRTDDPNSKLSQRMSQINTTVLKGSLGTHPKTRYVGISEEVI